MLHFYRWYPINICSPQYTMQYIIEKNSTEEYGHEVPSHGWPTGTFRNLFLNGPLFLKMKSVVRSNPDVKVQEAVC